MRIFTIFVEMAAAAIPLLPLLILCNALIFHNGKRTAVYALFGLYLATVFALAGLPSIYFVHFEPSGNFVPFRGLFDDLKNFCLNILLFVPLGAFLPCLWQKYRSLKRAALHGLLVSGGIEFMQIFTYRATDVDDLIANAAGTVLGFLIGRAVVRLFRIPGEDNRDLAILYGLVLAVMLLVQPGISNLFWHFIL